MAAALAILALVALAAGAAAMRRERELRRMARFLRERPQASNARIRVEMRSPGVLELAAVVNERLDEVQRERIASIERELELQRTLSALSHDIRTPLAAAQGYLQLLEEERDRATRERYETIMGKRLADVRQLLDELLLYAKAHDNTWQPTCEPVDVGQVLAETLASFYPHFTEKGWTPHVELSREPVVITSDAEALARIFHNLTANTLQHGASPPRIVQHGRSVTFANRLVDSAPADTSRMFERFYRGDKTQANGSAGLGLTIVSELAHALGASVEATVMGSTLSITVTL